MKFEIESKFNIGDKVHIVEGEPARGTVVKVGMSRGKYCEYHVMYLVEQEDETREWCSELDLCHSPERETVKCGIEPKAEKV